MGRSPTGRGFRSKAGFSTGTSLAPPAVVAQIVVTYMDRMESGETGDYIMIRGLASRPREGGWVLMLVSRLRSCKKFLAGVLVTGVTLLPAVSRAAQAPRFKTGFNLFSAAQDVQIGKENVAEIEKQLPARTSTPSLCREGLSTSTAACWKLPIARRKWRA